MHFLYQEAWKGLAQSGIVFNVWCAEDVEFSDLLRLYIARMGEIRFAMKFSEIHWDINILLINGEVDPVL
jgi:hypothetical protein